VGHAGLASSPYIGMGNFPAFKAYTPRVGVHHPRQGVYQFLLSVSVDTGNADNLSFPHPETYVVNQGFPVKFAPYRKVFHFENYPARFPVGLFNRKAYLSAYHHFRKRFFGSIRHFHGSGGSSLAQYGTAIGGGFNFV
jgi:hypothetical protein